MRALKDPDPEGPMVSHGLKSALKCIFALHIYNIMFAGPFICLGGLGGPTGWIRLGNQNEPKSGLDLRPVKNVNLLKDIAVLPLSIPF